MEVVYSDTIYPLKIYSLRPRKTKEIGSDVQKFMPYLSEMFKI